MSRYAWSNFLVNKSHVTGRIPICSGLNRIFFARISLRAFVFYTNADVMAREVWQRGLAEITKFQAGSYNP